MNYNIHAFDTITEESAYWIGFLMADGCVHKRGNSYVLSLGLSTRDLSHLFKFKSFMNYTNRISYSKNTACKLSVTNTYLCDKINTYGIFPRKSLTCRAVPELEMNRHFWRGMIDGDGSLKRYKSGRIVLELVGSKFICTQFLNFVKFICKTEANVIKHSSIYRVSLSNSASAYVATFLYQDSKIYLERKYKIFLQFLKKKILANHRWSDDDINKLVKLRFIDKLSANRIHNLKIFPNRNLVQLKNKINKLDKHMRI